MSWLVVYLIVASVGLIFVFAAFKIGGDADVAAPALQPGDQVEPGELAPELDVEGTESARLRGNYASVL